MSAPIFTAAKLAVKEHTGWRFCCPGPVSRGVTCICRRSTGQRHRGSEEEAFCWYSTKFRELIVAVLAGQLCEVSLAVASAKCNTVRQRRGHRDSGSSFKSSGPVTSAVRVELKHKSLARAWLRQPCMNCQIMIGCNRRIEKRGKRDNYQPPPSVVTRPKVGSLRRYIYRVITWLRK